MGGVSLPYFRFVLPTGRLYNRITNETNSIRVLMLKPLLSAWKNFFFWLIFFFSWLNPFGHVPYFLLTSLRSLSIGLSTLFVWCRHMRLKIYNRELFQNFLNICTVEEEALFPASWRTALKPLLLGRILFLFITRWNLFFPFSILLYYYDFFLKEIFYACISLNFKIGFFSVSICSVGTMSSIYFMYRSFGPKATLSASLLCNIFRSQSHCAPYFKSSISPERDRVPRSKLTVVSIESPSIMCVTSQTVSPTAGDHGGGRKWCRRVVKRAQGWNKMSAGIDRACGR